MRAGPAKPLKKRQTPALRPGNRRAGCHKPHERQIKARLHSATRVWREIDQGYAVGSFTAKLPGWQDTRRFLVVRETVREDKEAVGRRLLDVLGYTFRLWVTNRNEDPETLWRDYHQRATLEQRSEELQNDLHADGFCAKKFYPTEAAFLSTLLAYNLLAVYQAHVTAKVGWRKPPTLRAAVFVCGAILGGAGRKLVLRLSESRGGLVKHKDLLDKALAAAKSSAPRLPRPRPTPTDWDLLRPGGAGI